MNKFLHLNGKWFIETPMINESYDLFGPFNSEKEARAFKVPSRKEEEIVESKKKQKKKARANKKTEIKWEDAA